MKDPLTEVIDLVVKGSMENDRALLAAIEAAVAQILEMTVRIVVLEAAVEKLMSERERTNDREAVN